MLSSFMKSKTFDVKAGFLEGNERIIPGYRFKFY